MDSGCQNETVPEEGKSHRALTILANFMENDFLKETWKNENPNGSGRSGCQNETVPEEGKSHRALTILVNFMENDF